jgi:hypothetical protein
MKILLAPLQKLVNVISTTEDKIDKIQEVLTVDLVQRANDNFSELKKQTDLLVDIRSVLRKNLALDIRNSRKMGRKEKKGPSGGAGSGKMPSAMGAIGAGLVIVSIAAGLVAAAGIFTLMPVVNPMQLVSALLIASIFLVLAPVFYQILEAGKGKDALSKKMLGGGETKSMSPKDALKNTGASVLSMISMAIGITATSIIFRLIMPIGLAQAATAILIGLTLIPISVAFGFIIKSLAKSRIKMDKKGIGMLGMVSLSMVAIAVGIAGVAAVWGLMMPSSFSALPPLGWVIGAGISIAIFAGSFYLISKAVKGMSTKDLLMAAAALPLVALAIVGVSLVFQMFNAVATWSTPPLAWTLSTGLTLLIFSLPFIAIAMIAKRLDLKSILKATLAMGLISVAILSTAWIFSYLDGVKYVTPPLDWALGAALAITIFAIPLALIGLLATSGVGAVGILLGAAGIILIAGTMWVVAWIFSKLPDLSAISANFTNAIMYPVNSMVDVLKRVKEEIGVENLLPMAGGLLGIAAGWLALTAALAGQSIGGLVSGAANAIGDFLGFEGDGPADLIDKLAKRKDSIIALGTPMKILGEGIAKIGRNADGLSMSMSSLLTITDSKTVKRLQKASNSIDTMALAFKDISDASNAMNVEAINASSRMFEAIARIAENDGEDAITALAEDLLVAVKELSETVDKMKESNKKNNRGVSDAISSILGKYTDAITKKNDELKPKETAIDFSGVIDAIEALKEEGFDVAIRTK